MNNKITIELLLCLFLGCIGAHRFYTKKYVSAIAMLILTCIGCVAISIIWAIIDFVIIIRKQILFRIFIY